MLKADEFRVLITYTNLSMALTPSYAVGLFTAILKGKGYDVNLFDCTPYLQEGEFIEESLPVVRANKLLNSRKFDAKAVFGEFKKDIKGDYSKKLDQFKPHAVIFSTLVEDAWPQAKVLLEILSNYSHIKSLIGGIFTTMAPEVVIKNPNVQQIVIGEGEEVVLEFCECVRKEIQTSNIKGTWAKDVEIFKNPPRQLVDINKVIPDFSLFDERRFYRPLGDRIWKTFPLETYRGCPNKCTFCNSPSQREIAKRNNQGNFLRRKHIDELRKHIDVIVERYSPEFFYINDDAFMARPKSEILEFADMYQDVKIPFWFQTRFENVSIEKLERLAEVGCYRISFGLEHGNDEFRRKRLGRRLANSMFIQKAKIVEKVGIPYTINMIVGFPYETRELLMDSVRLCRAIGNYDSLSVNVFVPYHGTILRDVAIKEGWLNPEAQTTSVIAKSMLKMPKPFLNGEEILGLQRVFPLYAKMPESRYPEIRRAEVFDEEGDSIFNILSDEYNKMVYGADEEDLMLSFSS